MIALIDGDILLYRVGFSTEDVPKEIAFARMAEYIGEILAGSGASKYNVVLSPTDKQNFRYGIYKDYKGNRKQPKPKWFNELREYLIKKEHAIVTENQEADDLLGILQTTYNRLQQDCIICSNDKDLLQIPGLYYNFVKQQIYTITEADGIYNFYKQLLTGDTVDNIPGLEGIGPKKAEKILQGCETQEDYNKAILEAYKETHIYCNEQEIKDHINMVGKLLYIRKQPNEEWSFSG